MNIAELVRTARPIYRRWREGRGDEQYAGPSAELFSCLASTLGLSGGDSYDEHGEWCVLGRRIVRGSHYQTYTVTRYDHPDDARAVAYALSLLTERVPNAEAYYVYVLDAVSELCEPFGYYRWVREGMPRF